MGPRPAHLHLDDSNHNGMSRPPRANFHMDLPSPRTGEVPPALSPLDAFAMRSRLLARRFEDPADDGRRISRLPYTDVAKELSTQNDYFRGAHGAGRSAVGDMPAVMEDTSPASPKRPDVAALASVEEKYRPVSHYPLFGHANKPAGRQSLSTPFFDAPETQEQRESDYFGLAAPRASSPEPIKTTTVSIAPPTPNMPSLTNSVDSLQSPHPRTLTNGSTRSQQSLRPPPSPAYPKSPRSVQSIRSVPPDSGDEDVPVNFASRKYSGSSGMSQPQSPLSPPMQARQRSPSMTSEYSVTGSSQQMQRKARNFSRPDSASGTRLSIDARPSFDSRSSFETRPSADLPFRHPSMASSGTRPSLPSDGPSRGNSQDDAPTPFMRDTPGPATTATTDHPSEDQGQTYTYAKFTLPRGRAVERNSMGFRSSWIQKQFTWDEQNPQEKEPPMPTSAAATVAAASAAAAAAAVAPPQPLERTLSERQLFDPPARRTPSPTGSEKLQHDRQERLGRERATSSANRSRSADPRLRQKSLASHKSTPSVKTQATDSTERTIKAAPPHERTGDELTPDEHLEIGIQAHSAGHTSKSTYHLRLAAQAGLPTAMLLYALACRHGWGMRPNQEEGVRWLRKAIEGSGPDVADVEETLTSASASGRRAPADAGADARERKKRKAQFALAIYELGISYMNGWGCQKDKPLALRCYEVAGDWGDCDALAEAGFCYTQAVGCKKDLKRAAALYRRAAEGGMSMAGNSWIYKPKYMDDPSTASAAARPSTSTSRKTAATTPDKDKDRDASTSFLYEDRDKDKDKDKDGKTPTRSRPRTRSIWGRSRKA